MYLPKDGSRTTDCSLVDIEGTTAHSSPTSTGLKWTFCSRHLSTASMLSHMTDGTFQGDSRARLVYSHWAHATLVTEHLDEGFFLVGWPEGDRAVMVAQVDDGIMRVLAHHIESARLGADGGHLLSHRHIKVLQETCSALRTRTRTGRFVRDDYDHWNQLENSIFQILFINSFLSFSV